MSKPLREEVIDQAAHFGQALTVILPVVLLPLWIGCALGACFAGFWRELTQLRRSSDFESWNSWTSGKWVPILVWQSWHLRDRLTDIFWWMVGGQTVGLVVWLWPWN